jgi:hypothetical protein
MDGREKEKVKEDDFKNRRRGDEKGCIGDGGKEGQRSEKDQGNETIDVDQKGSQGSEDEGENGSSETQGDDEEAHPWDDEEVGDKSNRGETVEVEGHKRCCPQNGDSSDKEREHDIFEDIFLPRDFWKKEYPFLF